MGATARNIDFTDVKDGGAFNRNRIPAGDYAALITKVEDVVAKDKEDMFLFHIKIKSRPSSVFPYYCKLQENQLWKLRNILIAAGKTVPKKKMKVDPNVVVGKTIGVTIIDAEDYNDREQSELDGVFPAAELDDEVASASEDDVDENDGEDDEDESLGDLDTAADDEDDEADEPEAEEEEDDEEEEADPLADLSRTELKAAIVKLQADFQAKKSQTDDDLREVLRGLQAKKAAPKPAAKPAAAKAKPKAEDISDDELDELDIDAL